MDEVQDIALLLAEGGVDGGAEGFGPDGPRSTAGRLARSTARFRGREASEDTQALIAYRARALLERPVKVDQELQRLPRLHDLLHH